MNPDQTQVGGTHYKGRKDAVLDYAPWDFTVDALNGCFFLGNANKYIIRHRAKNGVEDLKKAAHYLDKLASLYDSNRLCRPAVLSDEALNALMSRYAQAHDIPLAEQDILMLMGKGLVSEAAALIRELVRESEMPVSSPALPKS